MESIVLGNPTLKHILLLLSWTVEGLPWQTFPRLNGSSGQLSLAGAQSLLINIGVDVHSIRILLWVKAYQMQTEEMVLLASFLFPPTVICFLCSI